MEKKKEFIHWQYETDLGNGFSFSIQFEDNKGEQRSADWCDLEEMKQVHNGILDYYNAFKTLPLVGDTLMDECYSAQIVSRHIESNIKKIVFCLK
jgi:hypothetical protein